MNRLGKNWKKTSLLTLRKVVHGVSGKKLNFLNEFTCNISSVKKTKKALLLVLKNVWYCVI